MVQYTAPRAPAFPYQYKVPAEMRTLRGARSYEGELASVKTGGPFVKSILHEADFRSSFDRCQLPFVGARTAKSPHLSRYFILIRKCRRTRSGVLHHVDRRKRDCSGLTTCEIEESAAQTKTDHPSDKRFGNVLHFLGLFSVNTQQREGTFLNEPRA